MNFIIPILVLVGICIHVNSTRHAPIEDFEEIDVNEIEVKVITGAYINKVEDQIFHDGNAVLSFKIPQLLPLWRNTEIDNLCNVSFHVRPECTMYRNHIYMLYEIGSMMLASEDILIKGGGTMDKHMIKPQENEGSRFKNFSDFFYPYEELSKMETTTGHRVERSIRHKETITLVNELLHESLLKIKEYSTQEKIENKYKVLKESINPKYHKLYREAMLLSYIPITISTTLAQMKMRMDYITNDRAKNITDTRYEMDLIHILFMDQNYKIWYQEILRSHIISRQACLNNRLPKLFVSETALSLELLVLAEDLGKINKELAINFSYIDKYYSLPLVTCEISESFINIYLKVPTKSLNTNWELFELHPIPLKYNEYVCEIETESQFVAKNKNEVIPLDTLKIDKCQPFVNELCYLESFNSTFSNGDFCTQLIITGSKVHDFKKCNYKCRNHHDKTHIKRISNHIFAITNPQENLKIKCRDKEIEPFSNYTDVGSIIVHLPCECQIIHPYHKTITPTFPCMKVDPKFKLYRVIPATWFNMTNDFIGPTQEPLKSPTCSNIKKCLDTDNIKLANSITTSVNFNLTTLNNTMIRNLELNHSFTNFWLLMISIIIMYLLIKDRYWAQQLALILTILTRPTETLTINPISAPEEKPTDKITMKFVSLNCELPSYMEIMITMIFVIVCYKGLRKFVIYLTKQVSRNNETVLTTLNTETNTRNNPTTQNQTLNNGPTHDRTIFQPYRSTTPIDRILRDDIIYRERMFRPNNLDLVTMTVQDTENNIYMEPTSPIPGTSKQTLTEIKLLPERRYSLGIN